MLNVLAKHIFLLVLHALQELTPPGPLSSSDYGTPYELIDWVLYYFRYKRPLVPFACQENLSGNYN